MRTVLNLIPREVREDWDGWDYKVLAPVSLDDEALIVIRLKNKGGSCTEVIVKLDTIDVEIKKESNRTELRRQKK